MKITKTQFVVAAVCVLIAYSMVSTMSWKNGELDGHQKMVQALSSIAPAVESIRAACRAQWAADEWESECALFFALREARAR